MIGLAHFFHATHISTDHPFFSGIIHTKAVNEVFNLIPYRAAYFTPQNLFIPDPPNFNNITDDEIIE
jgi:hypothetical protein